MGQAAPAILRDGVRLDLPLRPSNSIGHELRAPFTLQDRLLDDFQALIKTVLKVLRLNIRELA